MPKSMLMLTVILIAGFKTCNGTKPNALTKSDTTMTKPATSAQTVAERPTYASDVRPILQSSFQPCHFQGGQMYEKLRSINQKQLPSWGQSCSRASRTRTNNASSGSSSRNSLRALTASERGWTWGCVATVDREGKQPSLVTHPAATESVSLCTPMKN